MKKSTWLSVAIAGLALVAVSDMATADHFHPGQGYSRSDYGYRGPSNFDYGASRFGSSYQGNLYNGTLYRGPAGNDCSSLSNYHGTGFNSNWNSNWNYGAYRGYGNPNVQRYSPGQWNQLNHCTPLNGTSPYGNSGYGGGYTGYGGNSPYLGVFPR